MHILELLFSSGAVCAAETYMGSWIPYALLKLWMTASAAAAEAADAALIMSSSKNGGSRGLSSPVSLTTGTMGDEPDDGSMVGT